MTITQVNGAAIAAGTPVAVANGTVTLTALGTLTFTPAANYNGPASFTYTISDGTASSTATVSGTVTAVNDLPVAVADTVSGLEDTAITGDLTPGTIGQDSDIDGDTITVVDGDANAGNGLSPVVAPLHGTVVLNADGTFTYTPVANYNGPDSFTYRISDGQGGFATAVVSLTITSVNDAPAGADKTVTLNEDATYHLCSSRFRVHRSQRHVAQWVCRGGHQHAAVEWRVEALRGYRQRR